jgi:hypothetical protein
MTGDVPHVYNSLSQIFGAYGRSFLYLQPALREAVVLRKTGDRIGGKKTENVLVDNGNRVTLHSQIEMMRAAIRPEDL